jgi:LemA protein
MLAAIIVIVVIVLLIVFLISLYNGMVRARNKVDEGLERDRRAAEAAARPDPEPGGDGEGVRGARARDVPGGDRRARQGDERQRPAQAGAAEGLLSQALGRLFAVARPTRSCARRRTSSSCRPS